MQAVSAPWEAEDRMMGWRNVLEQLWAMVGKAVKYSEFEI